MDTRTWYQQLIKPSWAPPASVFGPVWSILYLAISISFGAAGYLAVTGRVPWIVALPFVLNLAFNVAFTPLQFGLRNLPLALLDLLLLLATLVWAMIAIAPFAIWITLANLPYLAWVSFAALLQTSITCLNRR